TRKFAAPISRGRKPSSAGNRRSPSRKASRRPSNFSAAASQRGMRWRKSAEIERPVRFTRRPLQDRGGFVRRRLFRCFLDEQFPFGLHPIAQGITGSPGGAALLGDE